MSIFFPLDLGFGKSKPMNTAKYAMAKRVQCAVSRAHGFFVKCIIYIKTQLPLKKINPTILVGRVSNEIEYLKGTLIGWGKIINTIDSPIKTDTLSDLPNHQINRVNYKEGRKLKQKNNIDRFEEMDYVAEQVKKEFTKVKAIVQRYNYYADRTNWLEKTMLEFAGSKIEKQGVRGYFTWKCFEYLSHEAGHVAKQPEYFFSARLPLMFEIIIAVQYLHNHILDEKNGVTKSNNHNIGKTLLEANLLKEILYIYIKEEINPFLSNEEQYFLETKIRNLFIHVDEGQAIDISYNDYAYWTKSMTNSDLFHIKEEHFLFTQNNRNWLDQHLKSVFEDISHGHDFTKLYFHRIYLTSTLFFETIVDIMTALIPGVNTDTINSIKKFAVLYGTMLQVINDYSDFAFSEDKGESEYRKVSGKSEHDVFADLYNFNVTLPLIFHLQWKHNRRIEKYLEGQKKEKKELLLCGRQIMQEIVMSGGIRKTQVVSRQLAEAAKQCLNPKNPAAANINDMCSIAYKNKFITMFKKTSL